MLLSEIYSLLNYYNVAGPNIKLFLEMSVKDTDVIIKNDYKYNRDFRGEKYLF